MLISSPWSLEQFVLNAEISAARFTIQRSRLQQRVFDMSFSCIKRPCPPPPVNISNLNPYLDLSRSSKHSFITSRPVSTHLYV